MLQKNTKEHFEKDAESSVIIAIGAGMIGQKFIREYGKKYSGYIVLCDNDLKKQGKKIEVDGEKYGIYPTEAILDYIDKKVTIVITCNAYSQIYRQVVDLIGEIGQIYVYPFIAPRVIMLENQVKQCLSDYYYHNHMEASGKTTFVEQEYEVLKEKKQLVIPYLPVYLTTSCTLNCEKCNNLMPYFKGKSNDFSLKKTKASLSRILECVQEITFCELVGGEPFLYKELEQILDYVGNQEKIRQIVIVTNGTIIPPENILKKLKKYEVLVRISDYGLFEQMAKLVIELEKYDINVRILQDMKWNNPGGVEKRNRTKEELFFQYNKCIFSIRCKYLAEDKLFTCARIASLFLLGKYDGGNDVMMITGNTSEEELKNFYLQDIGEGCDYCDLCTIDEGEEIPAAIQVGGRQFKHSQYTIIRNDYLERLKKR